MKKLTLTMLALSATLSVFAQGTVNFFNNGSGFKAPVYGPETGNSTISKVGNTTAGIAPGTQVYTGALLSGSNFRAQMFGGVGVIADASLLTAAAGFNTFRTGSAVGFLATTTATLSGVAADAPVATIQIRAWDNTSGLYPDWASAAPAWQAGLIAAGVSPLLSNFGALGGGTGAAANPVGLLSFNIYTIGAVPEPSTFVLAGLGAAGLLIFRRRK